MVAKDFTNINKVNNHFLHRTIRHKNNNIWHWKTRCGWLNRLMGLKPFPHDNFSIIFNHKNLQCKHGQHNSSVVVTWLLAREVILFYKTITYWTRRMWCNPCFICFYFVDVVGCFPDVFLCGEWKKFSKHSTEGKFIR